MPSEHAADRIKRVQRAIEDEQFETASEELTRATELYDEARSNERSEQRKVRAVRDSGNASVQDRQLLDGYLQLLSGAQVLRGTFLAATTLYLIDPVSNSGDEIVDAASELVEIEREATSRIPDVRDTISEVDLPATLGITEATVADSDVLIDESTRFSVAVTNVGDESAEDVSLSFSSQDGLEITPESETIDEIPPQGQATREATLRARAAGEFTIQVKLGSSGQFDAATDALAVESRTRVADETLGTIATLRTRVDTAALNRGLRNSLRSKLDTAETKITQGKRSDANGQNNKATNQYRAATRILGAFLNEIDAISKSGKISRARRRSLALLADNAIEQLTLLIETGQEGGDQND